MKTKTNSLKPLAIILSLLMIFTVFSGFSGITVVSAAGTSTTISTIGDLLSIADNPSGTYKLSNDIDASDVNVNIPSFSGNLDGRGYQIKINDKSLFGTIESSGSVRDLSVVTNSVSGEEENPAGILASVSNGTISRCEVRGSVYGTSNVGGLIGLVSGGTVSDCYSSGYITASVSTVGGLIGKAENAVIERCYSIALVSGTSVESGGLIGNNSASTITNCYTSSSESNQILGIGMGSDSVSNKTSDEIKSAQTFSGFDFNNTWMIIEGETTPLLMSINGKGTEQNPYRLHCMLNPQTNLDLLKTGLGENGKGKYFRLDSDVQAVQLQSYGDNENRFNGILDGSNHVFYSCSNNLFGSIGESGLVKNITFRRLTALYKDTYGPIAAINYGTVENCHVSDTTISGVKDLGGIVGENINGTIRRCSFSGKISGSSSGIGCITGYNSYGTITECSVKNGNIHGNGHSVGGVVGDNTSGLIENCMNYGIFISGSNGEVGGIAGRVYNGTVKNCYANHQASYSNFGSIVGAIIENATIENCYYNSERTAFAIGADGETPGDTTGALNNITVKSADSFAGFDFTNIWTTDEDGDLALLAIKGTGTKENPYIIRSSNDWEDAGDGISNNGERNYYILSNNIYDTSSKDEFSGSLNGQGYSINLSSAHFISDLNQSGYIGNIIITSNGYANAITSSNGAKAEHVAFYNNNAGLFGEFKDSTAQNCAVIGGNEQYSTDICGGFVNSVSGNSIIDNCYVRSLNLNGNNFAGGFVGNNSGGKITNCYVYDTTVSSNNAAGGFAGRNDNGGTIQNCNTNAVVIGEKYSGAFVGMNYAAISNAYANSDGGLEFAAQNEGSISDTYLSSEEAVMTKKFITAGGREISVNDTTVYTPAVISPVQNGLTDITGHWAEKTIQNLVSLGVVNGYEDNTYRPEDSVTKGEYIKLLMSVTSSGTSTNFTQYKDVNASWAKGYISRAIELGICDNINSEETIFGVDSPITRAEAAAMMGRLLASDKDGALNFSDTNDIPDWALNPVFASVELGLIAGNDDGSFKPLNNLTRAEAATIIERILNLE